MTANRRKGMIFMWVALIRQIPNSCNINSFVAASYNPEYYIK